MDDRYLQIELIKAVGNIAKAINRIADAIEHRTEKEFPNPTEKMINLARYSELRKALDLDDKSPKNETRDVIEAAMTERAKKIIAKKDLRCRNCTRYKHTPGSLDFSYFCEMIKKSIWPSDPACVGIDPTQETIDAMGEIKLNLDGEVIS